MDPAQSNHEKPQDLEKKQEAPDENANKEKVVQQNEKAVQDEDDSSSEDEQNK